MAVSKVPTVSKKGERGGCWGGEGKEGIEEGERETKREREKEKRKNHNILS